MTLSHPFSIHSRYKDLTSGLCGDLWYTVPGTFLRQDSEPTLSCVTCVGNRLTLEIESVDDT